MREPDPYRSCAHGGASNAHWFSRSRLDVCLPFYCPRFSPRLRRHPLPLLFPGQKPNPGCSSSFIVTSECREFRISDPSCPSVRGRPQSCRMALSPGQSCRLPPFAPQILQPADIVRDRRDARLDVPAPAVNMPARKHFLLCLGIGEPDLNVLVERSLAALRRQDAVSALLHDRADVSRWECIASAAAVRPARSRISRSAGGAVVSFDFPSTSA